MTNPTYRGKLVQGATEFVCFCTICGIGEVYHSHTGVQGAVNYFYREGWKLEDHKWYCPHHASKLN
jgi:hypothetical protein